MFEDFEVEAFLERLYGWSDSIERELDFILATFDDLFCEGSFSRVNQILKSIEVDKLDTSILIGFLSFSCCARDELEFYDSFVSLVEEHLKVIEPDRWERLMRGFF